MCLGIQDSFKLVSSSLAAVIKVLHFSINSTHFPSEMNCVSSLHPFPNVCYDDAMVHTCNKDSGEGSRQRNGLTLPEAHGLLHKGQKYKGSKGSQGGNHFLIYLNVEFSICFQSEIGAFPLSHNLLCV